MPVPASILSNEIGHVRELLTQCVVRDFDLGNIPPGRHDGCVSMRHGYVPTTIPPSTLMVAPVMKLAASLASQT